MESTYKHTEDLPIAFIGDVHGKFMDFYRKIKAYELENFIVFQVGDWGVGFDLFTEVEVRKEKKLFSEINSLLKKRNVIVYVTRGNHDNPFYFDGNHNFSNIIHLKDYDIIEVGKLKILSIGGAVSVDRKPNPEMVDMWGKSYKGRKKGVNWWPEEKILYNKELLKELSGVDIVVSHSCPQIAHPEELKGNIEKWIKHDPGLEKELMEERKYLSDVYDLLKEKSLIRLWIYGHHHHSNKQIYDLTEFRLLDVMEFLELPRSFYYEKEFDEIMENMAQSLFHMSDEEARPIIDGYLESYPILLEIHDREWYYKCC